MFEFINFIIEIIGLISNYILNYLTSIIDVMILGVTSISGIISFVGIVPPFLGTMILFVVIVGVLKLFFALGGNQ